MDNKKSFPSIEQRLVIKFFVAERCIVQVKFMGECQLCMVPLVSSEKMFRSELNYLNKNGEVLRMKKGLGGRQK